MLKHSFRIFTEFLFMPLYNTKKEHVLVWTVESKVKVDWGIETQTQRLAAGAFQQFYFEEFREILSSRISREGRKHSGVTSWSKEARGKEEASGGGIREGFGWRSNVSIRISNLCKGNFGLLKWDFNKAFQTISEKDKLPGHAQTPAQYLRPAGKRTALESRKEILEEQIARKFV